MSKPPTLDGRVEKLKSHVQVLEEKIQVLEEAYHRDLNVIKHQIAEMHLLFANSLKTSSDSSSSQSANPQSSPTLNLNLSVADVVAYCEFFLHQGTSPSCNNTTNNDQFYFLLAETCRSIENGQQFRLIEDLASLIPQLNKCNSFLKEYRNFLLAIATKKEISPEDTTISFLKAIGLPLLHASQSQTSPTISAALFYPLGDLDTDGKFISFHGFSKINLLNSVLSTYPLVNSDSSDEWFAPLIGSMRLSVRIDYHLLSTFKEFREIDSNGVDIPPLSFEERRGEINAVYNYLNHKSSDLSNSADPKLNMNDYFYWILFIIHALYQAEHLEVFALRHPLVNFILGDDNFFTLLKTTNNFLGNPHILHLTQDANEYPSYQSFLTRQFNDADFVQPAAYNNKPQCYLRLSTNNDRLMQFKWNPVVQKILGRELTL